MEKLTEQQTDNLIEEIMKDLKESADIMKSKEYKKRVLALEEEGCTTSDARNIAEYEFNLIPTKWENEK